MFSTEGCCRKFVELCIRNKFCYPRLTCCHWNHVMKVGRRWGFTWVASSVQVAETLVQPVWFSLESGVLVFKLLIPWVSAETWLGPFDSEPTLAKERPGVGNRNGQSWGKMDRVKRWSICSILIRTPMHGSVYFSCRATQLLASCAGMWRVVSWVIY